MKRMILRLMAVWSFVALISALVFNVFADTLFDNSDKTIYKASDAWNGLTNEDAVWRWLYRNNQTKNTATPYVEYTLTGSGNSEDLNAPKKNEDGTYDYSTTEKGTVTVFADSTANPGMRNTLGRYWMRLSVASGSEPKQSKDNRIVKQFTAPESGSVTISAKDMSDESKIYNRNLTSTNNLGAVVIISKHTADGSEKKLWSYEFKYNSETTVNEVETLDFENLSTYLNKGEELWFTISGETGGSAYAKQVFWNPVVSYYEAEDNAIKTFKATDAWSTDTSNKYNGHTEWKWEHYDATASTSGFTELVKLRSDKERFGIDPYDESKTVKAGYAYDQDTSTQNRAAVGDGWMMPRIDGSSASEIRKNHTVAKSFTAPKSGTVILSAEDVDARGVIHAYGGNADTAYPPYMRITKNGTKIWPKYGDYKVSAITSVVQDAPISSVALEVEENDIIRFEVYNGSGDQGWHKKVYWRPTVEYIDVELSNPVYCSSTGKDKAFGTEEEPYSLKGALDVVQDGGEIIVLDKISLDEDFVWTDSEKSITIKGSNENSEIDISSFGSKYFNINQDVTFESIKIGCAASDDNGEGVNKIAANGHHVVIRDTVTTTDIIAQIIGGSAGANVTSTNLEVYGGNYNTILGGCDSNDGAAVSVNNNCVLTVGGNVNTDLNDADWDQVRKAAIHGGGWGGSIKGTSTLTLKDNAKAKYVYGGQNGTISAENVGKVTINVEGGSYMNVYAILKNTKNSGGSAVKVDNTSAELNMTGGKAEALIGAQDTVKGNVVINALKGTVTRRIIAGVYNNGSLLGFDTSNHIIGTATVVIGGELEGFTDTQYGHGIFGGSRMAENSDEEVGTLIFADGSYNKFGSHIAPADKSNDICQSHHDYLVKASAGGSVALKDIANGLVTLTADENYYVSANGEETESGDYTLKSGVNTIDFLSQSTLRIKSVSLDGQTAEIIYDGELPENYVFVAALYDATGECLIEAKTINDAASQENKTISIELEYSTVAGNTYYISAMLWEGTDNLKPLCKAEKAQIVIPTAE